MKFTIDKREEIDSTNLEVIRRAKTGAPEGTLVQAERQISGRGRRGRAWESPAGSNLYMTLLLRPDVTMEQASVLTLIMALACQEGIKEATGLDCQIKWPNDLVLHKKKVVGILTEAAMLEQDEAFPEGETRQPPFSSKAADTGNGMRKSIRRNVRRMYVMRYGMIF